MLTSWIELFATDSQGITLVIENSGGNGTRTFCKASAGTVCFVCSSDFPQNQHYGLVFLEYAKCPNTAVITLEHRAASAYFGTSSNGKGSQFCSFVANSHIFCALSAVKTFLSVPGAFGISL